MIDEGTKQKLEQLVETWECRARNKFLSAKREKDAMGKRLIEHGAMCYVNCMQELKKALAAQNEEACETIILPPGCKYEPLHQRCPKCDLDLSKEFIDN